MIVYKISELQHKTVMDLIYWSTQSQADGQVPSKKSQAKANPIGP